MTTHLHWPGSTLPPICPCDTPNASKTKNHWTSEKLHCITGWCCFQNYKHVLYVTKDGTFVDNGEFPVSLGAYTTIPKALQGKSIDHRNSKYLDIIHLDIAFGDCASIVALNMPWSLWIVPHATIGALDSNLFNMRTSWQSSWHFDWRCVHLRNRFNASVMISCLVAMYALSYT